MGTTTAERLFERNVEITAESHVVTTEPRQVVLQASVCSLVTPEFDQTLSGILDTLWAETGHFCWSDQISNTY